MDERTIEALASGEPDPHTLASPRPWTYHTAPSQHGVFGLRRDWIEDAHGRVIMESVGYLDGPLICRAVNFFAEVQDAERQLQIGLDTLAPASA